MVLGRLRGLLRVLSEEETRSGFHGRWLAGIWVAGDDDDKFLAWLQCNRRGKRQAVDQVQSSPAGNRSFLPESRATVKVSKCTLPTTADIKFHCGENVSGSYSTNTPRADSLHKVVRRVILVDGYSNGVYDDLYLTDVLYIQPCHPLKLSPNQYPVLNRLSHVLFS